MPDEPNVQETQTQQPAPQDPPAPQEPQVDILEQELPEGQDAFPRSYVEQVRQEAAKYRTKYKPFRDTFGDEVQEDDIKLAKKFLEVRQTSEGIESLFWEAASAVFTDAELDAIEKALGGEQKPEAPARKDSEDEEELSPFLPREQFEQSFEELRSEIENDRAERQFQENQRSVINALDALGVSDDRDRWAVLSLGNKHIDDIETASTAVILDAVKKGFDEFEQMTQAHIEKYLKEKEEDSDSQPQALSGGSQVTGVAPEPPKDAKEAGLRLRKRMGI